MIPQSIGASLTLFTVTKPPIKADGKSARSENGVISPEGAGLVSATAERILINTIPDTNVAAIPQTEAFSAAVKSGDSSPERDRAATGVVRERTSAEVLRSLFIIKTPP
jgi:hypothetical protein